MAKLFQKLINGYPTVILDEWIVMPNHFHGIIVLTDRPCRGESRIAPTINIVAYSKYPFLPLRPSVFARNATHP